MKNLKKNHKIKKIKINVNCFEKKSFQKNDLFKTKIKIIIIIMDVATQKT